MKEIVDGYRVSYAQNREDIILAAFFEETQTGFYVDIGANDPEIDSVTKYFYERGWSGINCEPQSVHYERLFVERNRDINLNVGVGAKKSKLTLRQYKGDGLSTLSSDVKAEYVGNPDDNTKTYTDTEVEVTTLANIFREHKTTTIHFMKIDVEGFEYQVLIANDWNKYRPQVICIEANHIKQDWHHLLKVNDYELAFFDGLNEYFTDSRKPEIKLKFSYVQSVILGKPFMSYALAKVIINQQDTIKKITDENKVDAITVDRLKGELASVNSHVLYLQNALDEVSSLKAHIKKFSRKKLGQANCKIENILQPKVTFTPNIPVQSKDLLTAAHHSDVQNLSTYNQTFIENSKIRLYRKAKRIIRGKKDTR